MLNIRQQYHARMNEDGKRLIWDVRALIEKARSLPIIHVPLKNIHEIHENYWFDSPNGPQPSVYTIAEHAKLIQDCDLAYPILLCPKGRVMDGMHRICKALIQENSTITAKQFKEIPAPDYIDKDWSELPYDDDGKIL